MLVRPVGLIVLLTCSFSVLPLAAKAPPVRPLPKIGVLRLGSPPASPDWKERSLFLQELRSLGWLEGRNVPVEYRWAQGGRDSSMTWLSSSCSCMLMSLWHLPRSQCRL